MRPLTYTRPKVMLPIANKPILEHLMLEVRKAGIEEIVLIVGYHNETIRDYFEDGKRWGLKIQYATQMKQLGTAHALETVQQFISDSFILLNGDILVGAEDIRRLLEKDGTVLSLVEVANPEGLGVVEVEGDRVARIVEKATSPPSNLVNAGLYLLTADIFPAIAQTPQSPRGEYELTSSLQLLADSGCHISYQQLSYWLDVSYPWDLLTANESLSARIEPQKLGTVEENVVLKGLVAVGEGTTIRANSYIAGPVVIGANCEIGPNCYIRAASCIGDNCHIGSAVEVKNSIVMRNSKIPHHNYIGDSVIGEGCNFGAGTKIANLRLDKDNISAASVDTGRHKLGAIIGDDVQTGINASINVGSLIGDHTYIGPGAIASGLILPDSRIF